MSKYAILEGKAVVPCTMWEWAHWLETNRGKKIVEQTKFPNGVLVSTVFLGLDHSWSPDEELWFETLVFEGSHDGDMERYETYAEAEIGHKKMVDRVSTSKSDEDPK